MQEMQETQMQFLTGEDPLEEEMATHSSILTGKILWTEEPGNLQSMGLQKVGHHWATEHACIKSYWLAVLILSTTLIILFHVTGIRT